MNVDNLKRILPFESGSRWDLSSQKYMLIPDSIYQQKMKIDIRDMLQSIKQPEQREMLKRYSLALNVLQGPNTDMDRYQEAIQDFSVLKN